MSLLADEFLGNPLSGWLIAVSVFIALGMGLQLARRSAEARLAATAAKTSTDIDDIALHLLRRTRVVFIVAMALYVAMLAVTLVYIGILFWAGNPDWRPVAAGYLGLLLMGASFIAAGLLISSMTKNQIVAGIATFGVFLLLWIISWIGEQMGPRAQTILSYLSVTEHFDDFAKGIIDTKHVVYYLSFITFGLFLTAKSVDSERWRG